MKLQTMLDEATPVILAAFPNSKHLLYCKLHRCDEHVELIAELDGKTLCFKKHVSSGTRELYEYCRASGRKLKTFDVPPIGDTPCSDFSSTCTQRSKP
jgi:hypothetical protein